MHVELEDPHSIRPAFHHSTWPVGWWPIPGDAVRGRWAGPDTFGTVITVVAKGAYVLWSRPLTDHERSMSELISSNSLEIAAEEDRAILRALVP
jgi:hypothetical protein